MTLPTVALITGSTSGIGLAIAKRFLESGMSVLLHGLEAEGAAIARELEERYQRPVAHANHDLSSPDGAVRLALMALERFGGVDVVVNNAGIQYVAAFEDFPRERWQAIFDVNLTAAFVLTQELWPGMKARRFGRVINIASVHGLRASEFKAAYVAAKHGMVGLTKVMAIEGASYGITANVICPGYVKTPLVERQVAAQALAHGLEPEQVASEIFFKKQPLKEFIAPEAIAELAQLMAGEHGATMTGSVITVDGGWTAQ